MLETVERRKRRKKRHKAQRVRKQKFDRRNNTPFPWGAHWTSWCFNCRREIREYDLVHMGTFYDDQGRVDAFVHYDCRDFSDRPRVPRPEPNEYTTSEGIRRWTMATKTKKSRKSRKQRVEDEDEEQTTAQTDLEDEMEDEDEEETPAPKSKKSKKGKKAKTEKARKERAEPGVSFAQSTGEQLVPLLESAPKKVLQVAKALAAGKEVTHEQLVTLKEGVKAHASSIREEDAESATQLSALNSRVRRLERSAR